MRDSVSAKLMDTEACAAIKTSSMGVCDGAMGCSVCKPSSSSDVCCGSVVCSVVLGNTSLSGCAAEPSPGVVVSAPIVRFNQITAPNASNEKNNNKRSARVVSCLRLFWILGEGRTYSAGGD